MKEIRVRIAPSPTGVPHIGNTRTALFNWLFARHHGGKFVVRIEDTDRDRLVPGSQEKILEILQWLGLDYDEGPEVGGPFAPYVQSERKDLYQKYALELVADKRAVKEDGAIRFIPSAEGATVWKDLVHKEIKFENKVIEPFVILKSDGFPTYHLANVVDDHLMEISHVLRGDEWISSTPKHIQIYQALGWKEPLFGHLPLIFGGDKSKLSKRHGAGSVLDYRDQGYLKEALINFMVLLGWNPASEKELYSMDELIKDFDLEKINLNNPIFDPKKLDWFNGLYIRQLDPDEIQKRLLPFLPKNYDPATVKKALPLVQERMTTLADFETLTSFLFTDKIDQDQFKVQSEKFKVDIVKEILKTFIKLLDDDSNWQSEGFEKKGRELAEKLALKTGDVFMILRVAISGKTVTPPLFESMEILGKEKTINRLQQAFESLEK